MNENRNVQQVIIIRKDLLKLSECELAKLSQDRQNQYFKELQEIGKMGPGKLAAQIAHASMAPILKLLRNGVEYSKYTPPDEDYDLTLHVEKESEISQWLEGSFKKIIVYVKSEEKLLNIHKNLVDNNINCDLIKDAGFTAFTKPTYTSIGIEPMEKSKIDPFTKKLRLLD